MIIGGIGNIWYNAPVGNGDAQQAGAQTTVQAQDPFSLQYFHHGLIHGLEKRSEHPLRVCGLIDEFPDLVLILCFDSGASRQKNEWTKNRRSVFNICGAEKVHRLCSGHCLCTILVSRVQDRPDLNGDLPEHHRLDIISNHVIFII